MFYFNPISYFFKSFIRLFTKKFFWVILILLLICIGWALYDKGVFAETISNDIFSSHGGISQTEFDGIANFLSTYNSGYDSVLIRKWPGSNNTYVYNCIFYNFRDAGRLYISQRLSNSSVNIRTEFNFEPSDEVIASKIVTLDSNFNITFEQLLSTSGFGYDPVFNINYASPLGIMINRDIYNDTSFSVVGLSAPNQSIVVVPTIETESSSITNWSFDYLHINSGSETIYYNNVLGEQTTATLYLDYVYNDIRYRYQIPANLYGINTNDTFDIYIPRTSLLNNVNITNGSTVSFYLGIRKNTESVFPLGSYTFVLTTEEQEQIQQDSDKALQGEILGAQQETNNKLDSIENTITDTTIPDDSEFDLPTIEVNDSTANFFDTLFTGIYNAFNTNEDTSISFTIFSKTITINSADFRMLNDNGFTILRNLLESSWYFAIGYMILKDIRHIFDKIKTGNIENAVSNDIKADMV